MSSWFKDLSNSVQSALPKFEEGGILQSLTLTTPELRAERERIDAEEKRKKEIRNMLAGMLPWQTQDPDRDILVEECREAILQLSKSKETFFGPFPLPPMKAKSGDDDEDHTKQTTVPSTDSLEKLAKLQPLPPLLENFEFLAHVGLIEKILAEDPNLVEMQSTLSGGGARERVFWNNYFFHCAYTRYEAGLSIDEIWSEEARLSISVSSAAEPTTFDGVNVEETITFNEEEEIDITQNDKSDALFVQGVAPSSGTSQHTTHRSESDYEIVDVEGTKSVVDPVLQNDEGIDTVDNADYELDELEAEIARELED